MKPSKEERKLIKARSQTVTHNRIQEIEVMVYEQPDGKYREAYLDLLGYIQYLEDREDMF